MTVCLGNICRSPAAEAVLIDRLEQAGLDHVTVSSAGTADYHVGSRPHELSRAEGEARGYRFQTVGAQFTAADLESADLILVMDEANLADVGGRTHRVGMFRDLDPVDPGGAVPDPYYGGDDGFAEVLQMVERTCDRLVTEIGRVQEGVDR